MRDMAWDRDPRGGWWEMSRKGRKHSIMLDSVMRFAQSHPGTRCLIYVPSSEDERETVLDNGSVVEYMHYPYPSSEIGIDIPWSEDARKPIEYKDIERDLRMMNAWRKKKSTI